VTAPSITDLVSKAVAPTITTVVTLDVRSIDFAALWLSNPSASQTLYGSVEKRLSSDDAFALSVDASFAELPPSSTPVLAAIDTRDCVEIRLRAYYSGAGDTVTARALAGAIL